LTTDGEAVYHLGPGVVEPAAVEEGSTFHESCCRREQVLSHSCSPLPGRRSVQQTFDPEAMVVTAAWVVLWEWEVFLVYSPRLVLVPMVFLVGLDVVLPPYPPERRVISQPLLGDFRRER
jgi:hypothetical protein